VVVARKDLPASDLKGLVAWLRANPDKATEGTAGPGSGQHVSGIYFQEVTRTRFQFVPYRAGSSEIMRDLVAGHIDLTFDQAITALPHVRNGGVKAYAVTSNKRLAAAPDIPTVDEPVRRVCIFRLGMDCGCRKAPRPKQSASSRSPQWTRLPTRRYASG
jgi:tripartite-type tricarboxylate transporter receptor subunit TctC